MGNHEEECSTEEILEELDTKLVHKSHLINNFKLYKFVSYEGCLTIISNYRIRKIKLNIYSRPIVLYQKDRFHCSSIFK